MNPCLFLIGSSTCSLSFKSGWVNRGAFSYSSSSTCFFLFRFWPDSLSTWKLDLYDHLTWTYYRTIPRWNKHQVSCTELSAKAVIQNFSETKYWSLDRLHTTSPDSSTRKVLFDGISEDAGAAETSGLIILTGILKSVQHMELNTSVPWYRRMPLTTHLSSKLRRKEKFIEGSWKNSRSSASTLLPTSSFASPFTPLNPVFRTRGFRRPLAACFFGLIPFFLAMITTWVYFRFPIKHS